MKWKLIFTSIVCFSLSLSQAYGEKFIQEEPVIQLKSRTIQPPADRTTTLKAISGRVTDERAHVLIQFTTIPDAKTKHSLNQAGISLLNYVPKNSWFASIPVGLSADHPALNSVRWIGPILPEDKLPPRMREKGVGAWARTDDGRVRLVVKYFSDVSGEEVKAELERLGAEVLVEVPMVKSITIAIAEAQLLELAKLDAVRWIEPVSPPGSGESDRVRGFVQADLAQGLGLSGSGVTVGVFEPVHVDAGHPDFGGRVTRGDTDPNTPSGHTTMVGGLIAGDGSKCNDVTARAEDRCAVANQWQGISPAVDLYTYGFDVTGATDWYNDPNLIADLQTAVNDHHIDVANNSWGRIGCHGYDFEYGIYRGLAPTLDAAVRGDADSGFERPVSIVFSTGNERAGYGWDDTAVPPGPFKDCIADDAAPYENYGSVNAPKAAKNIITVGAIDSFNNMIANYSSWGPVEDGRLKPDIVAAGHHNGINEDGQNVSEIVSFFDVDLNNPPIEPNCVGEPIGAANQQCYRTPNYDARGPAHPAYYYYAWFSQTSAAAATTTGSIALLLEDFRNQLPGMGDPLPSTIKALLIHTAQDLDDGTRWFNPGPDYASGYGLLRIKDAIDLMREASFVEGVVVDHGDEVSYSFTAPPGAGPVKVTLVWDDFPAIENADPALVNDLDLVVEADDGTRYFPWTLDPDNPDNNAVRAQEDHTNNVEQVFIPAGAGATYTVTVAGHLLPEGPQPFSLVFSPAGEVTDFNPVDVMLVLDLSGSMLSPACSDCDSKLNVLKDAVEIFVQLWSRMALPDHRIGVTYFKNLEIDELEIATEVLLAVRDHADDVITDVRAQTTLSSNLTPMGGGLQSAINRLIDVTRPRNIVLFTDGMQNVNPMVLRVGDSLVIDNEAGRDNSNVDPTPDPTVLDMALGRKVNTIGVGATDSFVVLLSDIAGDTGGVAKITTAPDHDLRQFFIEDLVHALRDASPQLIAYRHRQLPSSSYIETFNVNRTARQLLFKVSWRQGDSPIEITQVEKDGVDLIQQGQIIHGDYYRIYSIDLPVVQTRGIHVIPEGNWQVSLSGSRDTAYEIAAIADEAGLNYTFSLGEGGHRVGQPLPLQAHLTVNGQALTDVENVIAEVLKPGAGMGSLLSTYPMPDETYVGEAKATIGQRKLDLLLRHDDFYAELLPMPNEIRLHHQGDGFYSAQFSGTDIPGPYTVVFHVNGQHPQLGRYVRTESLSTVVEFARPDVDESDIRVVDRVVGPDINRLRIWIRPRDMFGNYLGPDYGHVIDVSVADGSVEDIVDLGDGWYEALMTVPTGSDPNLDLTVMNESLYSGPMSGMAARGGFAVGIHLGQGYPSGSFNNLYDADFLLELALEYRYSPQLALNGVLGHYTFDPGYDVSGGTLYLRGYRPFNSNYLFAEVGAGIYKPDNLDTAGGLSAGIGADLSLSPRLRGEFGANYFHLFNQGDDIKFIAVKAGLRYNF